MTPEPRPPPARTPLSIIGPAALAVVLMSYPWLAPGMQGRVVFGVPLAFGYFFGVWALCIVLAAAWRVDG